MNPTQMIDNVAKATGDDETNKPLVVDDQIQEEMTRRIREILKEMPAPFCCSGSLSIPEAPTVEIIGKDPEDDDKNSTTKDQKTSSIKVTLEIDHEGPNLGSKDDEKKQASVKSGERSDNYELRKLNASTAEKQSDKLKVLLDHAPPAVFGKGTENVLDESVRKAKQLAAENFVVSDFLSPRDLEQSGVLNLIQSKLNIHSDLSVELYSLNIYEKGGKFLKHKDTPRGDDMIGTLVMCLPSLFRGGELVLTKGNEEHVYFRGCRCPREKHLWNQFWYGHPDWWLTVDREQANNKIIPWAAFFGDVDHEIQEVGEGLRVTLAYTIRRKDKLVDEVVHRPLQSSDQMGALVQLLRECISHRHFLPDGGRLGFGCDHLYTNRQIFPVGKTSEDPLSDKAIKNLKGRDMLLSLAATEAGPLKVYIVSFLCTKDSYHGNGEAEYLPKFLPPNMHNFDPEGQNYGEKKENEEVADLYILDPIDDGGAEQYVGAQEYFGNSCMCEESYYVRAILAIEFSPVHERQDLITKKARSGAKPNDG